jgi:hypothetical protein
MKREGSNRGSRPRSKKLEMVLNVMRSVCLGFGVTLAALLAVAPRPGPVLVESLVSFRIPPDTIAELISELRETHPAGLDGATSDRQ